VSLKKIVHKKVFYKFLRSDLVFSLKKLLSIQISLHDGQILVKFNEDRF
jgi:hypothetical protein